MLSKWIFRILLLSVAVLGTTIYILPSAVHTKMLELGNGSQIEILVKYTSDSQGLGRLLEVESAEMITPYVELLTFSEEVNMKEIKAEMEKNSSIEFFEPNYEYQITSIPDDPFYTEQWWIPHVKANNLWANSRLQEKRVVVAVIDSGIDLTHEDLVSRIASRGYNFYSNTTDVRDLNGHGTKVAGVIAAQSGNGKGISGITGPFDIAIMPIRITDATGRMNVGNAVKAVDYAIANKVAVINMSFGGPQYSKVFYEALERARAAGIMIIASAGNEGEMGNTVFYPAAYDNVLSVGAVDQFNNRSSFSNYNEYVDLVAPGENIFTTFPNHSYNNAKGTSFSAPILSGTVGMLKALQPNLTVSEIEELLISTATDLGSPGRDLHYGHGLLNIDMLLKQLNKTPFIGDFADMRVTADHTFKVVFSHELLVNENFSSAIKLSSEMDESFPVSNFTTTIAPGENNVLLIKPINHWDSGDYYLTISKEMRNTKSVQLKNDVRIKFTVE